MDEDQIPATTAERQAGVLNETVAATTETPATVSIEVPAQHVALLNRAVALLAKGEQTIVDNLHAGVTMLEDWFEKNK